MIQTLSSCATENANWTASQLLISNKLTKPNFPIHTLQQGIYRSSSCAKLTIPYGTRVCLQLGQFVGFTLPSHIRFEEGRETRMCTILQSSVLSNCIVQQLAALISSFEFDRASGSTERGADIRNTALPSHHQQIPSRAPRRPPWPSGSCILDLATACVLLRSTKTHSGQLRFAFAYWQQTN